MAAPTHNSPNTMIMLCQFLSPTGPHWARWTGFFFCIRIHILTVDSNGLHQKLKYNVSIPCVFLALDIFSCWILYTAGREVLELEGLGLGSVCLPSVSWSYIDSLATSAGLQVTRWRNLICPLGFFFFSPWFLVGREQQWKVFHNKSKSNYSVLIFLWSYALFWQR